MLGVVNNIIIIIIYIIYFMQFGTLKLGFCFCFCFCFSRKEWLRLTTKQRFFVFPICNVQRFVGDVNRTTFTATVLVVTSLSSAAAAVYQKVFFFSFFSVGYTLTHTDTSMFLCFCFSFRTIKCIVVTFIKWLNSFFRFLWFHASPLSIVFSRFLFSFLLFC